MLTIFCRAAHIRNRARGGLGEFRRSINGLFANRLACQHIACFDDKERRRGHGAQRYARRLNHFAALIQHDGSADAYHCDVHLVAAA